MTFESVQQRGHYYEELQEGVSYVHSPGRTIGETDNVLFSAMTMNPASIHLDAASSASTHFEQRLVNSLYTLSLLVGLSVAQTTQGTTVANLGFESVEFPKPVFIGDTLYASTTVVSKRLSASREDVGIVTFEHTALNQDGVTVAVARRAAMMHRRPAQEQQ